MRCSRLPESARADRCVVFLSAANRDLLAAAAFYEGESRGLGAALIDEVERMAGLVRDFPELGTLAPLGARRVHLTRFPFALVYKVFPDRILVVALEHQSRAPGFWADRVRERDALEPVLVPI